jgi:hypothetical protein
MASFPGKVRCSFEPVDSNNQSAICLTLENQTYREREK